MSILVGNPFLLNTTAATGYQVSRSLRFNASDSAYLSRSASAASTSNQICTISFWVKRSTLGSKRPMVLGPTSGVVQTIICQFKSDDTFGIYFKSDGSVSQFTLAVFRDTSAWYHILVAIDTTQATASNRCKIFVNGIQQTSLTGTAPSQNYTMNWGSGNSDGMFISSNYETFDGLLAEVFFIDGQALTPSSFTEVSATTGRLEPKQYAGSFGTNGFWLKFSDNSAATATTLGKDYSGNSNNWTPNNLSVTGLVDHTPAGLSYRDSSTTSRNWDQSSASSTTSAAIGPDRIYWVDLGASKSFNRITFSVVASGQSSDTSTNFITYFSTSSSSTGSTICGGGCTVTSASRPSATTPGTITVTFAGFASQTGRYIGITNGSGAQGGTYTYSNFKVYDDQGKDNDSLVDTPTSYGTDDGLGGSVRGNYATLNPLDKGANVTLTNGNLDVSTASTWNSVRATFGLTSGKWYWEYTMTAAGYTMIGIGTSAISLTGYIGQSSAGYAFYSLNGNKWNAGTAAAYGNSFTTSDVIGVAFDADAGKIWFAKNGTWQASGDPAAGTNAAYSSIPSGSYFPTISQDNSLPAATGGSLNAGARSFAYTAPSGFKALCDTNLPAPVVAKPNTVFDVKTYSANNGTQAITGLNFSPDLVWTKSRSNAYIHNLYDTVRGATKYLKSNSTEAEGTNANTLISFDSAGFTLGQLDDSNYLSGSSVAWVWDAGTTTSSNGSGSITSSVRANTSAGFSIVTFTSNASGNATVGHGLGVAPSLVILKNRTGGAGNWLVFHKAVCTKDNFLYLNSTNALGTYTDVQGAAIPSSTVFGINAGIGIAGSADCVAYCFAPVAGYSSFGSFSGGSNPNFVHLGFRPRFVMIKRTDTTNYWIIQDAARNAYNQVDLKLAANASVAENDLSTLGDTTQNQLDFVSNGFVCRSTNAGTNTSGGTYIYCAWAESPFQYARAR